MSDNDLTGRTDEQIGSEITAQLEDCAAVLIYQRGGSTFLRCLSSIPEDEESSPAVRAAGRRGVVATRGARKPKRRKNP